MIKLLNILNELLFEKKLCPKGRAYYNRRKAAGEKPSAYLSGRAVKVCKGLMEEDEENENDPYSIAYDEHIDMLETFVENILEVPYDKANINLGQSDGEDESDGIIYISSKIYGENPTLFTTYHRNDNGNLMNYEYDSYKPLNLSPEEIEDRMTQIKLKRLGLEESLRDWFKKEDWVRIDTAGNITGPCGTMKKGKATTRCLPRAKANSLTKAERAATARKKVAGSKKGDQFVSNTKKAKVSLKEVEDPTIQCEKCGHSWKVSQSDPSDLYICHNCNFDNSYKYNNDLDEYDVENEQDIKEFVEFMREYQQQLSEADCDCLLEAKYQGRTVQLGKIMQGDIKKFKVYVKNDKGKVVKVNFGFGGKSAKGKRMVIKAKNPKRRAAFRARHNCDNPGPRTKARYWSCRKW